MEQMFMAKQPTTSEFTYGDIVCYQSSDNFTYYLVYTGETFERPSSHTWAILDSRVVTECTLESLPILPMRDKPFVLIALETEPQRRLVKNRIRKTGVRHLTPPPPKKKPGRMYLDEGLRLLYTGLLTLNPRKDLLGSVKTVGATTHEEDNRQHPEQK